MRRKKLQTIAYSNGIFFLLIFAIMAMACYLSFYFAYQQGKEDGYVSGYMNGAAGVYAEQMPSTIERDYFEFAASAVKTINENVFTEVRDAFSKTVYENEVVPGQDYIYVNGKISERQFEAVQKALDRLPVKLLESFQNNAWVLRLTENDILINYAGSESYRAAGVTNFQKSTITIKTMAADMPHVVLHEFGHYLDHISEKPSQSNEWKDCYMEEWTCFYTMNRSFHAVGSAREYFAEVFAWYIESPEDLKANCPKSYAFMQTQVEPFL